MDDLAASLATSFSVSNEPNTTAAQHPRFSQYKSKRSGSDQEARRRSMLEWQKRRRFNAVDHVRRLGENTWDKLPEEEEEETKPEEEMDVEVSKQRPGRHYKNQLMLSEWLVEVPDNFEEDWILVPCPVGRRNLVVASKGQTASYTKGGYCMNRFPSHLPGGARLQRMKEKATTTILDCIYSELTRTYYVLDIMCWRDNPVFDSETEFRFYWLNTKLQEVPELLSISKLNPCRFEALPNFRCDRKNLENVLSTPMNIELDGLLFYHKETHYTFGSTPLVGWLKAYMVPEMLNIAIPPNLQAQKPSTYTTFADHVVEVQKSKEQSESENSQAKKPPKPKKDQPQQQQQSGQGGGRGRGRGGGHGGRGGGGGGRGGGGGGRGGGGARGGNSKRGKGRGILTLQHQQDYMYQFPQQEQQGYHFSPQEQPGYQFPQQEQLTYSFHTNQRPIQGPGDSSWTAYR